jgi:beta-lactamase class A
MPDPMTRRALILATTATATACANRARASPDPIAALERAHGGRLGVFALDTATQRTLAHRPDERFLLCSTFKAALAACVLHRVDTGVERLDRRIAFGPADLLPYAPFCRAHIAHGGAPVEQLCQAAVELSDNTAANLLLASIGGPPAWTAFIRSIGDTVTRLDRTEPDLNHLAGERDTTTPRSMALVFQTVLTGGALHPASSRLLNQWLQAGRTGFKRLRAGLPPGWRVGDKTGTGDAQYNDVAIVTPPGGRPIFVTAYYAAPGLTEDAANYVLQRVGAAIGAWAG